jgi:CRISPR/Cas system-associated exonuclease Cas4 (RecB family)
MVLNDIYKYTPQEVTSVMNLIDTYIRHRTVETRGDRSYEHYHPSEFGDCLRKQQYKHYAWQGLIDVNYSDPDSQLHRLFDKGHNMHARWVDYFDKIGDILLGKWKCKNILCYMFNDDGSVISASNKNEIQKLYKKEKSRIYQGKNGYTLRPQKCVCGCSDFMYLETDVLAPDINIKGNADILINCRNLKEDRFKGVSISYNSKFLPIKNNKIVIDMKTIGSKAWKNQLQYKGPHKKYLIQLTSYIHVLDCDYGIVAYENKDTSEMKWYQVPRNDKWWEAIQYQAKTMMNMSKDKKLPPPKHSSKSDYSCRYCEFKNLCHKSKIWNDANLSQKREQFYQCLL